MDYEADEVMDQASAPATTKVPFDIHACIERLFMSSQDRALTPDSGPFFLGYLRGLAQLTEVLKTRSRGVSFVH